MGQTTIIRCFDQGLLKGYRVPGGRERRIPHEYLMKFLDDNNMPNPFTQPSAMVLVGSPMTQEVIANIRSFLINGNASVELRNVLTFDDGMTMIKEGISAIVVEEDGENANSADQVRSMISEQLRKRIQIVATTREKLLQTLETYLSQNPGEQIGQLSL